MADGEESIRRISNAITCWKNIASKKCLVVLLFARWQKGFVVFRTTHKLSAWAKLWLKKHYKNLMFICSPLPGNR